MIFLSLDDLSRAFRIISKSIGRDWTRLYWHLSFYPIRGQEELSKDIKNIDEKYQRGDVYQVIFMLYSSIVLFLCHRIKL